MNKLVILTFFMVINSFCSAQENNDLSNMVIQDTLNDNKPQTKIIVNKEYDENGNLISFDSSYSYFYSNMEQDSTFGDSSFTIFQEDFFNSFPNRQRPFLNDLFFEDSLLGYDFYKDDFFSNRFKYNRRRFDKLFEEMDSLKNEFYRRNWTRPNK